VSTQQPMKLYAIFRRSGWTPDEIEAADARSNAESAKRADRLRKIRSYLLDEPDGTLGTICIYQAVGPEAIIEHSHAADLPCDGIVEITAIDVHRPDPELSAASAG
jgi:hypothetical protein